MTTLTSGILIENIDFNISNLFITTFYGHVFAVYILPFSIFRSQIGEYLRVFRKYNLIFKLYLTVHRSTFTLIQI